MMASWRWRSLILSSKASLFVTSCDASGCGDLVQGVLTDTFGFSIAVSDSLVAYNGPVEAVVVMQCTPQGCLSGFQASPLQPGDGDNFGTDFALSGTNLKVGANGAAPGGLV